LHRKRARNKELLLLSPFQNASRFYFSVCT
jgi:hypothetical protein